MGHTLARGVTSGRVFRGRRHHGLSHATQAEKRAAQRITTSSSSTAPRTPLRDIAHAGRSARVAFSASSLRQCGKTKRRGDPPRNASRSAWPGTRPNERRVAAAERRAGGMGAHRRWPCCDRPRPASRNVRGHSRGGDASFV